MVDQSATGRSLTGERDGGRAAGAVELGGDAVGGAVETGHLPAPDDDLVTEDGAVDAEHR